MRGPTYIKIANFYEWRFAGGGREEKFLTPNILAPEGRGAPKFFSHRGLGTPYLNSEFQGLSPPGRGGRNFQIFRKIFKCAIFYGLSREIVKDYRSVPCAV